MWFSCANGTRFQLDEQDRDLADHFNWWSCRDPRSGEITIRRNTSRTERTQGGPKKIALHQEIAKRIGIMPPSLPDHRDRDKTNNCRNNIRPATPQQNQMNRRKIPRNGTASSPYKGVSFTNNPRVAKTPLNCRRLMHMMNLRNDITANSLY